jgi:hypothetical protein
VDACESACNDRTVFIAASSSGLSVSRVHTNRVRQRLCSAPRAARPRRLGARASSERHDIAFRPRLSSSARPGRSTGDAPLAGCDHHCAAGLGRPMGGATLHVAAGSEPSRQCGLHDSPCCNMVRAFAAFASPALTEGNRRCHCE